MTKKASKVELSILERCALRDTLQAALDDQDTRKQLKAWRVHAIERVIAKIPPVK